MALNKNSKIAWTVGKTSSYDKSLEESKEVKKIGRNDPSLDEPYGGGCIFESVETAQEFIDENNFPYSVYQLKLPNNWETDVDQKDFLQEGFHRLINSALVVCKED